MQLQMNNLVSDQNDLEYQTLLAEVSKLFDNEPIPGTEKAERFESLLKLIDSYESINFPI
jgi:HTH-type transcriptional regulator/antitoxin HigA